jgi:PAS domain S-box-containing protein
MNDQRIETDQFEPRCLEALKALSKAMTQLSLYEATHPLVAEKLDEGARLIGEAVGARDSLIFAKDQERWLANGRVIGTVNQTGGPVLTLITRFKLSSISFTRGLTAPEMAALCELAASRPESVPDAGRFLVDRGVKHIIFNKAIYAAVDENYRPGSGGPAPTDLELVEDLTGTSGDVGIGAGSGTGTGTGAGTGSGEGTGSGASASSGNGVEALESSFKGQTIEKSLLLLIRRVTKNQAEQEKIFALIMEKWHLELEHKVLEATKTLRKEKTLIESEHERTQSVMENVGEGIIVVDGQGRILLMNPAAEAIYGATLAESAGKPVMSKANDGRVVALAADIESSLEKPPREAVRLEGAAGTKKTIRASWAVVQNEGGRVVGVVMTLTELAKHRELEKTQRDVVAYITHELRSPLTSITASLQMLFEEFKGRLSDDQQKLFAVSLKNSQRLASLINDILDFSKIDSGNMSVNPKKVDASKIAAEAVDSLGPWAQNRKLRLTLTAAPALPPAWADSQRTVQVLVNLLSNAIKFTPPGGAVEVRVFRSPTDPDRWIGLSVADNGPGIAKADQARLFQAFMQVISGGDRPVGGTGLGLVISKALVQLQGGQMWFESFEGRGTIFSFTLPVYRPPVEKAPPPPRPWWKRLLGLG